MRIDPEHFSFLYLFAIPFIVQPFFSDYSKPAEDKVNGHVDDRFRSVLEAFRKNFANGDEREGAAFSVFYKGQEVVDLWGGYADREAGSRWKEDTRTVMFSASKAIGAIVIAVMVDRGMLSYEDRLVDYWPEYGRYGKNATTLEDVLTHKAGIPYLTEEVTLADIQNPRRIMEKVENSIPIWTPGTASGYHAVSIGFILDGLVQKVDPRGRDIKTFFREEIAEPYDLDIQIAPDKSEVSSFARITTPGFWDYARDIIRDPRILAMLAIMNIRLDSHLDNIRANTPWLQVNYDTVSLNNPDVVSLNIPSVTAVAKARDFSRLMSMILEKQLISNGTLDILSSPSLDTWHFEKVSYWPIVKGHGFFYDKHPLIPGAYTFGHPGYGGQFVHMDPLSGITITYLSNGLKTGTGELCNVYMKLLKEVYKNVKQIEN